MKQTQRNCSRTAARWIAITTAALVLIFAARRHALAASTEAPYEWPPLQCCAS